MKTTFFTAVLVIFGSVFAGNGTVHAQVNRTWVSATGDDTAACSRTAPCRTFAGAIAKTNAGGEINILDPGTFGIVTINKSISIISQFEAGVSGAIGVNVASTDKVLLEGLDLDGLGTAANGVNITGGGRTTIRKCSIRNFTGSGVNVVGTTNSQALVEDCLILNNGNGLNIEGASAAVNSAFLERSVLDNNNVAVKVAPGNTVVLIGSTLVGSVMGISAPSGASVISYGNNVIRNGGAPTQTLPLQ